MADTLRVIDRPATVAATLTDAKILAVSKTRNGWGRIRFSIPHDHADATEVTKLREVRWEFDPDNSSTDAADTVWWGVIIDITDTPSEIIAEAVSLEWYFSRRFVGDADRTNLLANGDFTGGILGQSPPPSWTESGASLNAYNSTTITPQVGTFGCEITSTARDTDTRSDGQPVDSPTSPGDYHGRDESLQQSVTLTTSNLVVVKGWYFIRDDATFGYGGKPFDRRGLFAEIRDASSNLVSVEFAPIDDNTPRNEWQRAEFMIFGGQNTYTLNVRLYGPGGGGSPATSGIVWDSVGAYLMESLSFADGTDVVDIIEGLIAHAQDTTFGKDDLSIDPDPANSASGTTMPLIAYQHADHAPIWDAVLSYCAPLADPGVNISVTWNSLATLRYITIDTPPTSSTVSLTLGSNVIDVEHWGRAGEVSTRVLALGPGSGPDREEASASDTSNYGGLILERLEHLSDEIPIRLYQDAADGLVAEHAGGEDIYRFRLADSDRVSGSWFTAINPGDLIDFTGTWGTYSHTATNMRVLSVELDPTAKVVMVEATP